MKFKTTLEYIEAMAALNNEHLAILNSAEKTEAQVQRGNEIVAEMKTLKSEKEALENELQAKADAEALRIKLENEKKAANTIVNDLPNPAIPSVKSDTVVTSRSRNSRLYKNNEDAYLVGRLIQAVYMRNDPQGESVKQFLAEKGYTLNAIAPGETRVKTLLSSVEGGAGLMVLPQMEAVIVRLIEEYGVIRKESNIASLTNSSSLTRWKRKSGTTAYFLGETGAPTSSQPDYYPVTLTPKVLGAISKYSLILEADAAIMIADEVTREIAYSFMEKEDTTAFVGDGTSTYGGILGISKRFEKQVADGGGTWATDADKQKHGGIVLAAGNAASEFTMQNFVDMTSKVARYPGIRPKWYIHDAMAAATMDRLRYALGGNTTMNVNEGLSGQPFLGYPVVYVNAMPATDANSQVACLFGDLKMGTDFCDRQGIEFTVNTQSDTNFQNRTAEILGTERFDFNAHDTGIYDNSDSTKRKRGAIAALVSANS